MASKFGSLFIYHCDNLCNPEGLDYLIDIVRWDQYYPTIYDKAGLYCFTINSDHIFHDGNKRTGLEAALLFLELNGMTLQPSVTEDHLIDFAWAIAKGECSRNAITFWFENHTDFLEGQNQGPQNLTMLEPMIISL